MSVDKYNLVSRFLRADKPSWASPLDCLIITRLLTRGGPELQASVSHGTLAIECAASVSAVQQSLNRLNDRGWLVRVGNCKSGRPKTYTPQVEVLPIASDLKSTVVGAVAADLAKQIHANIRRLRPKKRVFRGWQQRFGLALQKKLDDGMEPARLAELLTYALRTPPFQERALKGPQALRRLWFDLEAAHNAAHGAQT